MVVQEREKSGKQKRVADRLRRVMSPDTGSFLQVSLFNRCLFGCAIRSCLAFVTHTSFGEFCIEITTVSRLGCLLLFLLLQSYRIKVAVCGRGCVAAALGCLGVLGFLAFLLFRETLEEIGNLVDRLVPCRCCIR